MTDKLVALHVHSEHSCLDGLATIDDIVNRVVDLGQSAVAITDHGECSGHLQLQHAADKAGIKPIYGMEGYFTENRHEKAGKKGENYDHMTILAMNSKGLENLWSLSSLAYIEGSYYGNPRFDWELLEKYNEGLIITGGCMGGCIGKHLKDEGNYSKAVERIGRYQAIFGERFHLELHTYLDPESNEWNLRVAEAALDYSVPLITVADSHYAKPDQWYAHELMTAIQMGKTINDPSRFSYGSNQLCLFSEEETRSRLSYLPDSIVDGAIKRTGEIADMCDARVPGSRKMPVFYNTAKMDERKMRETAEEGFARKIVGHTAEDMIQVYRDRLEYEIEIVTTRGFPGYFLTVQDLINWSKSEGFLVGPSRGCFLPGSYVGQCNGEHKLIELIEKGDKVTNYFEGESTVINTFVYEIDEDIISLEFEDGAIIKCTQDHKFLTQRGWVPAIELTLDDEVIEHYASLQDDEQN